MVYLVLTEEFILSNYYIIKIRITKVCDKIDYHLSMLEL